MQKIFSNYGIDIQHNQVDMLQIYYHLLLEWNTKINLTTITEYNEIVKKHFLDSCLLLKVYSKEKFSKSNIIDVGTGAGFPGIPLSILLPDAQFTLLDSLNKLTILKYPLEILPIFALLAQLILALYPPTFE